ncbi:hypothetical protein Tco_0350740 [Tanacetum coccineum]
MKERNEKLKEVKARLHFGGCSETLRYSESRTMSTKEYEKRHRKKEAYSKGWAAEKEVCPHTPTAATNTPARSTQRRSQKARTAGVGLEIEEEEIK